jgi:Ran GTPase-activating protein (RanGAP) involved in mRNA processing and transport
MPPLRDLNLSRNNISDRGAISIAEFVGVHYHLKTLKVSWNKIKSKGAIAIAEALKDNQRIVLFDGSFNLFGVKRNGEFGLKMGEAINKGILRHLDISYNSLDKNECQKLADTIVDNHSLWGLHIMGNDCVLDSLGFIRTNFKNKI